MDNAGTRNALRILIGLTILTILISSGGGKILSSRYPVLSNNILVHNNITVQLMGNNSSTINWFVTEAYWNKSVDDNPIVPGSSTCGGAYGQIYGEGSVYYDDSLGIMKNYYRGGDYTLCYAYTNTTDSSIFTQYIGNPLLPNGSLPYRGTQGAFPTFEHTLYGDFIIMSKSFYDDGETENNNVYLWKVENNTTLIPWNNGNPILTWGNNGDEMVWNTASLYDYDNKIWNIVYERTPSGFNLRKSNVSIDLSIATNTTVINFDTNKSNIYNISGLYGQTGNPDLVRNRTNAVLYFGCNYPWDICRFNIENNFTSFIPIGTPELDSTESYEGVHVTDPSIVIFPDSKVSTLGKGFKNAMYYTADQVHLAIARSNINIGEWTSIGPARFINGTVIDSMNMTGIPNVIVTTDTSTSTMTNATGFYSFAVNEGLYNLTATFDISYYTNTTTVSTIGKTVVMQDIELVKKQTGNITGNITST